MDLHEQLRNLFPDHQPEHNESPSENEQQETLWVPFDPVLCKFEKRNGKVHTIIEGYTGSKDDFKKLSKMLKTQLSVGGSHKDDKIIIQGDYRNQIMDMLKELGFKVKRVGG